MMRTVLRLSRAAALGAIFWGMCGPASAQGPVEVGSKPPRGAIVLFDGTDSAEWKHTNASGPIQWLITNGYLEVKPRSGSILSRREFGDCSLHVEFNLPLMPGAQGQARANSGVYLQGRYEIQVLDSFRNPTYANGGVGAIYGQKDPDKDAVRPPGVWQAYDIHFRAARLDSAGKVIERPRMTVFHNGVLIHDNVEIAETETLRNVGGRVAALGPILLQDHGNPVRFRNIWVIAKQPSSGPRTRETARKRVQPGNWD
jgi:hypothetical protein